MRHSVTSIGLRGRGRAWWSMADNYALSTVTADHNAMAQTHVLWP